MSREKRRKNRQRAIILRTIVILLILLLLTVAGLIVGSKLGLFAGKPVVEGSWYRDIDISEEVTNNISNWLGDDEEVDSADIKVRTVLTMESVTEEDGSVTCSYKLALDRNSYDEALAAARDILGQGLSELCSRRALDAGYSESDISDMNVIIEEALGMSLSDYIDNYGPELMQDYETMCEEYNTSGSYALEDSAIIWSAEGVDTRETYVLQDDLLIFSGQTDRVYRRED